MVLENPKLGSTRDTNKLISATIPPNEKEQLKLSTKRSTDQVGMAFVPTSGNRTKGKVLQRIFAVRAPELAVTTAQKPLVT